MNDDDICNNVYAKAKINSGFELVVKSAAQAGFKAIEEIKKVKAIQEVVIEGNRFLVGTDEESVSNRLCLDPKFLSAIPKLIMKDTSFMTLRKNIAHFEGFREGAFEYIPVMKNWATEPCSPS